MRTRLLRPPLVPEDELVRVETLNGRVSLVYASGRITFTFRDIVKQSTAVPHLHTCVTPPPPPPAPVRLFCPTQPSDPSCVPHLCICTLDTDSSCSKDGLPCSAWYCCLAWSALATQRSASRACACACCLRGNQEQVRG